jgi:hypothetical protein
MRGPRLSETLRFGDFELDVAAYELRRHGRPVSLGGSRWISCSCWWRRRQLVPERDRRSPLGRTSLLTSTGVATAISRSGRPCETRRRAGLPETVPGKGYRFIATVSARAGAGARAVPAPVPVPVPVPVPEARRVTTNGSGRAAAGVLTIGVVALTTQGRRADGGRHPRPAFENPGSDPA